MDFNDTRQKREGAQWQSKLELLRQYQEWNGHCRVPCSYEIDGVKLGIWLSDQRVAYKKHSEGKPAWITQERIDQLEAIGLDLNDTKQKRDEAQWQSKFELLREYKEQHGHCQVPQRYEVNGVKLGIWVKDQRQHYLYKMHIGGKPARISHERINALNAIGLEWFPRNLTRMRVAPTAGQLTKMTPVANRRLSKRAAPTIGQSTNSVPERTSPRLNCGKRKRNTPEHLVLDRTRNQATVANQSPAKEKGSDGRNSRSVTHHSSRRTVSERLKSANNPAVESIAKATATDTQWDEHFDRLVEFKWNHGHCRMPVEFCVDGYYLGQWVVVQRLQHNRLVDGRPSSITTEQVERLNAIDFVWKVR